MKKKINGISYDTEDATLIFQSKNLTSLSGRLLIKIFRNQTGQWFQTVGPADKNDGQNNEKSASLDPETARRWLEKRSFTRQIKDYFGSNSYGLKPERKVLVAEWITPNSINSNEGLYIERLYYTPRKGWILNGTKGTTLLPLNADEASKLIKSLQFGEGHIDSPLSFEGSSLYEGDKFYHKGETLWP